MDPLRRTDATRHVHIDVYRQPQARVHVSMHALSVAISVTVFHLGQALVQRKNVPATITPNALEVRGRNTCKSSKFIFILIKLDFLFGFSFSCVE
ncbi:hypothetical protein Sjap_008748 [Stephania japonica]|uniref:Uncharacterized protein n=1 Tax=Stephania japonica TaxID=461633 RepID=A0AAP0JQU5_9MAGN